MLLTYNIERTEYGVKLIFGSFIDYDEMIQWQQESKAILPQLEKPFHVFVDMRDLQPLPREAREVMVDTQNYYRQMGMDRSVVILSNLVTTIQFKRIARESGIADREKYIDASLHVDEWETLAMGWLLDETDPDGITQYEVVAKEQNINI